MSSSYSSLDWVLSHWAHFTVHRFICVCVYLFFCFILHSCCIIVSTVGWTSWDWSLILWTYLPSALWHRWLGHLTRKKPSPIWPVKCVWWDVKPYSIINPEKPTPLHISSNLRLYFPQQSTRSICGKNMSFICILCWNPTWFNVWMTTRGHYR